MSPGMISFGGVYLPVLLGFVAVTGVIYWTLHWLSQRVRLHRLFWHPALVGAAVFVIILSCLLLWLGP